MRRRALLLAAAALLAPVVCLVLEAARLPLPASLNHAGERSVRVFDRTGTLLREVRTRGGEVSVPVRYSELSPELVAAILAAEDGRFFSHPGVDPLAVARAASQWIAHGRIVSGGSTITQQLARAVALRPRTVAGKFREMALALRIEWSLSKERILEEYLSRIYFGGTVRGLAAASHLYFDKPPGRLGLAEAAALAAIPRGPALYDPHRRPEALRARRDRVLRRMEEKRLWDAAAVRRALAEPLGVRQRYAEGGAPHFVRALVAGKLERWEDRGAPVEVVSTLDGRLQREAESLLEREALRLAGVRASAIAAVVLDNDSAEVLAYVGSPDFFSEEAEGQNDGVLALRQAGSTLKPFVYAVAMEELGLTLSSVLPDVELHLPSASGTYSPKNYDRRYHGPVRLRAALGSSLNVPAVHTASRVGVDRVLSRLRALGFSTLDRDAAHYGPGLALGDGEIRLLDLAAAYATLARGGEYVAPRFVRRARREGEGFTEQGGASGRSVIDPRVAALLASALSDPSARVAAFGQGSALDTPFPAAVKTGTTKGFRDNLAVGFTRNVTVAVWVGNFDGSPMVNSSGVTGAAPLLRELLAAAERDRAARPLVDPEGLVEVSVCALSGHLPGPNCPHAVAERFVRGSEPRERCTTHVRLSVDGAGRVARDGCPRTETRVFERYDAPFTEWAATAGRPTPPTEPSALCPPDSTSGVRGLAVTYPPDGARFALDAGLSREQQQILFRARGGRPGEPVRFILDGRDVGRVREGEPLPWSLTAGRHVLRAVSADSESAPVAFFVR